MSATFQVIVQPTSQNKTFRLSPTSWMNDGTCRIYPLSTFFPIDGKGVIAAKKICQNCPVALRCLNYALTENIEHGVWGGTSERERRRILKRRVTAA